MCPFLKKKILNDIDKKHAREHRVRSVKFSECQDEEHSVVIKENGVEGDHSFCAPCGLFIYVLTSLCYLSCAEHC